MQLPSMLDCLYTLVFSSESVALAVAGGKPLTVMATALTLIPKTRVTIFWLRVETRLLLNVRLHVTQVDAYAAGSTTRRGTCGSVGVGEDRFASHANVQERMCAGTIEIQT